MTARSLRPFLETGSDNGYRTFVSSGLQSGPFSAPTSNGVPPATMHRGDVAAGGYSWRMAVQEINGTTFKFVCCKGACNGAPSTTPPPVHGWTQLLFDVLNDECDMHDLSRQRPDIVQQMRPLLPPSFGCGTAYASESDVRVIVERQKQ
jgi:hypothetical protein